MDGPSIRWAVMDTVAQSPSQAMVYHVVNAGYGVGNPVGSLVGGIVALAMLRGRKGSYLTYISNGGLIGGALGMTFGLSGLYAQSLRGEACEPLPWNEDGIQMRVNGLRHNYKVRLLDNSVWFGLGLGASMFLLGNKRFPSLSFLQWLSLGSTLGSFSGFALIANSERNIRNMLEQDE